MKIPTISAKNLWHWGDLQIENRYERGISLEGNLFSMSACPMAWQQIARLGGSQLHIRESESVLLDMHSILFDEDPSSKAARKTIESWGVRTGLLHEREIFTVTEYDDELERDRHSEYLSWEEAEHEAFDPDQISSSLRLIGTAALIAIHNLNPKEIAGVEYAVIEWTKAHASNLVQGVYWNETLDPFGYSAPRAGMFDAQSLDLKPASEVPEDEDGLQGISHVRWVNYPALERTDEGPSL